MRLRHHRSRLLNLEMSKDRPRCLSVELGQNREMWVIDPALQPATSAWDHSAFSNLRLTAPMKGSNGASRNACRYRYAPSSIGGEDRPRGYSGLSYENSEASRKTKHREATRNRRQCWPMQCGCLGMFENADETDEASKQKVKRMAGPQSNKRSAVSARAGGAAA